MEESEKEKVRIKAEWNSFNGVIQVKSEEYWEKRCMLAEIYIELITKEEDVLSVLPSFKTIQAYKKWSNYLFYF